MIVLDASAAVAGLVNDGRARRLVADEALHAPHLVDAEVASALRRLVRNGSMSDPEGRRCLESWQRIGVMRYAGVPLLDRVWALRDAVSTYDAMYVALAENLDCALVTADVRLSRVPGLRCAVTVVPD